MKNYLPIYCLHLLLIFITSCHGQAPKEKPKEKAGKPKILAVKPPKIKKTQGNNVSSSLQDKAGNLWFGTGDGVYKYDGKTFSLFTMANGLNSNKITSLLEDKAGKIWIGTEAGLCLYDGKTFKTIQIPLRKNMPPNTLRNTHNVFSMMQDKSGKLWFATIDGVYTYDGKTFMPFIIKENGPGFMSINHNVEFMLEDNAGNIWFGGRANEGVYRYDDKTITNLKINELKDFNWAWPALQDKKGNIWFTNWSGAYRYDGDNAFLKVNNLPTGGFTRIIEDKKGILWFGGSGGIGRYDGKSFTHLTLNKGVNTNLPGSFLPNNAKNDVWSILEDKTGHIWVGTRDTGLYRFDGKSFISYSE